MSGGVGYLMFGFGLVKGRVRGRSLGEGLWWVEEV